MSYSSTTAEPHPDDVVENNPQETVQEEAKVVAEQESPEEEKSSKTGVSWEQRRINKLVREKHEAERRAALAEQAAEHFRRAATKGAGEEEQTQPTGPTQEQFATAVDAAAAKRQFDAECTNIYHAGMEELQGFESRLKNFSQVGGLNPTLIEAVMESANLPGAPKAHRILHELGGDLDEAARILELPPVRMAAAIARFAVSLKEEGKKVSSAPAPIRPITPAAAPAEKDPEKMSPQEWREWREKTLAAKNRR